MHELASCVIVPIFVFMGYTYNAYNTQSYGYNPYMGQQYNPYEQQQQSFGFGQGNFAAQPVRQPQPQQNFPVIPGRVVESIDVVNTMDIPMDGNLYFFPKADGTEIYTKRWLPNVTTQVDVYTYVNKSTKTDSAGSNANAQSVADVASVVQTVAQLSEEMQNRLSALDAKMAKIEKSIDTRKSKSTLLADDKK